MTDETAPKQSTARSALTIAEEVEAVFDDVRRDTVTARRIANAVRLAIREGRGLRADQVDDLEAMIERRAAQTDEAYQRPVDPPDPAREAIARLAYYLRHALGRSIGDTPFAVDDAIVVLSSLVADRADDDTVPYGPDAGDEPDDGPDPGDEPDDDLDDRHARVRERAAALTRHTEDEG